MKLQILIPQYNEDEKDIKVLLDSISIQQNVDLKNDIGVIITNDGSQTFLSDDFLNQYDFKIEYYKNPHLGVSATRNFCLDKSCADYVMFCDADDMFYNACGLYIILREIDQGQFDTLVSCFLEETKGPKGETLYVTHQMDSTFVHGKVHRRKFLLSNNIKWKESLTIHEDSFFNCLAQRMATEVKYCQSPFYLWRWRDNSVCRHDPKYILKTYNNMIDSSDALIDEFLDRGKKQDAAFYATSMVYDAYYTLNKEEWVNQQNTQYRFNTEKRFKQFYLKFKKLIESIPEEQKAQIIVQMKNRFFTEGLLLETITFDDWIKHVEKDY